VQWCAGSATVDAVAVADAEADADADADFLAEADGSFLALPPGRNTTSSAATSPAAATALKPVSQRLRTWRCLTVRISC
jgi:hypothetical protein